MACRTRQHPARCPHSARPPTPSSPFTSPPLSRAVPDIVHNLHIVHLSLHLPLRNAHRLILHGELNTEDGCGRVYFMQGANLLVHLCELLVWIHAEAEDVAAGAR